MERYLTPIGTLIEEFDIDELETLDIRRLSRDTTLSPKLRRIVFGGPPKPNRSRSDETFEQAEFTSSSAYRSIVNSTQNQLFDEQDVSAIFRSSNFILHDTRNLFPLFGHALIKGCSTYKASDPRFQQLLLRQRLTTKLDSDEVRFNSDSAPNPSQYVTIGPQRPGTNQIVGPVMPNRPAPNTEVLSPSDRIRLAHSIASIESLVRLYESVYVDAKCWLIEDDPYNHSTYQQTNLKRLSDISALVPLKSEVVFGGMEHSGTQAELDDVHAKRDVISKALNVSVLDKFSRREMLTRVREENISGDYDDHGICYDVELRDEDSDDDMRAPHNTKFERFDDHFDEAKRAIASAGSFVIARNPERFVNPVEVEDVEHFAPLLKVHSIEHESSDPKPLYKVGGEAAEKMKRGLMDRFRPSSNSRIETAAPGGNLPSVVDSQLECFSVTYAVPQACPFLLNLLSLSPIRQPEAFREGRITSLLNLRDRLELLLQNHPNHPLRLTVAQIVTDLSALKKEEAVTPAEEKQKILDILFGTV